MASIMMSSIFGAPSGARCAANCKHPLAHQCIESGSSSSTRAGPIRCTLSHKSSRGIEQQRYRNLIKIGLAKKYRDSDIRSVEMSLSACRWRKQHRRNSNAALHATSAIAGLKTGIRRVPDGAKPIEESWQVCGEVCPQCESGIIHVPGAACL